MMMMDFLLGAGLRGVVYKEGQVSIHPRGGFRLIMEEYGGGVESELVELELGIVARFAVDNRLAFYGGLDLIPLSEGEIDFGNRDTDIDRDDRLGLRLGAEFGFQRMSLNGELALVSEEAFILRLKFPL